ncbi:lytic transglycosylase domain-containing protein [Sporolactobacillus sp. THM7-7]|nr:lytic transglycosylase domain-containing protein [Sporolactobacillus sp. THM7-7]
MTIDGNTLSRLLSMEILAGTSVSANQSEPPFPQPAEGGFSDLFNALMLILGTPPVTEKEESESRTIGDFTSDVSEPGLRAEDFLRDRLAAFSLPPGGAMRDQPAASAESTAASVTGTQNAGSKLAASERSAYHDIVQAAGEKYSVDPRLIASVIDAESGGNPNATSAAGAQGLMQLMPSTAASLGVTNPYDPIQNIEGGTRYLRTLLDRFGGNERLALAAYNAGTGNVIKYGGIPPFSETQAYVRRVLDGAKTYRA